jgi:hypothetical protein
MLAIDERLRADIARSHRQGKRGQQAASLEQRRAWVAGGEHEEAIPIVSREVEEWGRFPILINGV